MPIEIGEHLLAARSIGVLYDHRDGRAKIAKLLALKSPIFRNFVEMESSTLSARSRKLFTLSALYYATSSLLQGVALDDVDKEARLAEQYWAAIDALIPEWRLVRARKMTAAEVRRQYLHSHGIALHALGRLGNTLLLESTEPDSWRPRLEPLAKIDWSRSNQDWEGRALVSGRVSKNHTNVVLTVNYLRKKLGMELGPEEASIEATHLRGER
jgi:DNA sulfur modification protein DndB